jgi:hypothetical protein
MRVSLVAHPVENTLVGSKFQSEAAEVTNAVSVAKIAGDCRETSGDRCALADLLEHVRHRVFRSDISRDLQPAFRDMKRRRVCEAYFEITMGTGTLGMDDAFRRALAYKMRQLFHLANSSQIR